MSEALFHLTCRSPRQGEALVRELIRTGEVTGFRFVIQGSPFMFASFDGTRTTPAALAERFTRLGCHARLVGWWGAAGTGPAHPRRKPGREP